MSEPRKRRPSKPSVLDDGYLLPDELWARMEPLLPPRQPHPVGCHNPRTPDRKAMDAILFVLRTGCQWNALNATEPPLVSRRLQLLRGWSHDEANPTLCA